MHERKRNIASPNFVGVAKTAFRRNYIFNAIKTYRSRKFRVDSRGEPGDAVFRRNRLRVENAPVFQIPNHSSRVAFRLRIFYEIVFRNGKQARKVTVGKKAFAHFHIKAVFLQDEFITRKTFRQSARPVSQNSRANATITWNGLRIR